MKLISQDQKIVVFGSNGMVGSAIMRKLKDNQYLNILAPKREELNLLDSFAVVNWFNQNNPEVVVIASAKVGGIFANNKYPADFILENLKIQTNIIETAWKKNTKKLLFLGSSCIYPKYSSQPIKEEELLKGYLEPTNEPYAIAKIAGLKLCQALNTQYKFNAISLMPTNLYGPGDNYHPKNSHVLPSLIRKLCEAKKRNENLVSFWGTGNPKREFLHVDDLADACLFALEHWNLNNDSSPKDINGLTLPYLNVGTGLDISIRELANLIAEIVDYKGNISWDDSKPDGTPKKKLDISRIKELGWQPKIKFKDGLRNTIEIYREIIRI